MICVLKVKNLYLLVCKNGLEPICILCISMAEYKGKGAQNSVSFMRSALAKYVYMLVNVIDQSSRTTHLVDAIYVNLIMHDLIHTNQNSEFHKL